MTEVTVLIYKLASFAMGGFFCYLGYKLFDKGVSEKAGELDASVGEHKFSLRSAAPGTFFVVLGAAIILMTLWKGITSTVTSSQQLGGELGEVIDPYQANSNKVIEHTVSTSSASPE